MKAEIFKTWSTAALKSYLDGGTAHHDHSVVTTEEWDGELFPECPVCVVFTELDKRSRILDGSLRKP